MEAPKGKGAKVSAALDLIAEGNPNIGEQLRDWQIARTQNNEDAYDWNNFRSHVQAIGAPDPGDEEPSEFRQYDWTKYAPSGQVGSDSSAGSSSSSSSGSSNPSVGQTQAPQEAHNSLLDFLRHPFGRR
jgi:hypothetical protein